MEGSRLLRVEQASAATNPAAVVMGWETVSGMTYRVQTTTNLTSGWLTNAVPLVGDGASACSTNAVQSSPQFFRISVDVGEE